ncbi:MAG: dUTP diphosphatase [Gammaproteobacteria bacterium]|jgi:dUTP pyrophosphatase|tara:strand:- start:186 stop:635 length:450 start_codon:yes stop_codon:yes gene_type:complete
MLDKVEIRLINKLIKSVPVYSTDGSAGLDLRAAIDDKINLGPNETILIPTGLSVYIKNKDYAATILPRSGLGHKKGIVLGNLVGLIDSDYQGELMISCWNRSVNEYIINPLDRIAQLVFIRVEHPRFEIVDAFDQTDRGDKGFGSSGTK